MSPRLSPLSEAFGVEVHGLDVEHPSDADRGLLRRALREHGLLLFRGLDLPPDRHVAFTRIFGEPDIHPIASIRMSGHPEIIVLSVDLGDSLEPGDPAGDEIVGRIPWHSDLTYTAHPSRGALLHARTVPPEGGDTGYVDTAAVHAALPPALQKRIAGLRAVHSLGPLAARIDPAYADDAGGGTAARFEAVTHPLVHRHPETGERVLNISPAFARSVEGLSPGESGLLLDELRAFATQDHFTYFHAWQPGDLLIWDNWRTMHTATGHKKRHARLMHRTTLRGGVAPTA